MEFPVIETADTKNGVVTSNSSSWTLTYPTNLASGDLILAFLGVDGASQVGTWPAGFNRQNVSNGAANCICAAKISDGSETGNLAVTLSASEQGGWRVFRITGWFGSGLWTDLGVGGTGLDISLASGSSATPDPPNLDPANWATEDTLWIAACGVDTSRTISVFPLANNQSSDVSGGAGGATLGLCTTNSAVSSLNPGTFTISTSDDWAAVTIAVRPAADVAQPPRYGFVNYQDPGVF